MLNERVKEDWVEFTRFDCIEGHIDMWRGDSINDPNRDWKHSMSVNSIVTYYRLSDTKEWIYTTNGFELQRNILEFGQLFPANEIWIFSKINNN